MNFDQIQTFIKTKLEAHPVFDAKNVPVILDDGTYPKSPGREAALKNPGLVLIVWQIDGESIEDNAITGLHVGEIYVPVVVEENVEICRKAGGIDLHVEQAVQHVMEACVGQPSTAKNNRRVKLLEQPFKNFGKIGGVNRAIVNLAFPFAIASVP